MLLSLFVSFWLNSSYNTKIILPGLILTDSVPSASLPCGAVGKVALKDISYFGADSVCSLFWLESSKLPTEL